MSSPVVQPVFVSETTGPKVTFNLTNVGPPSMVYMPVEEQLFLKATASIAVSIQLRVRFMLASGQIIWMVNNVSVPGTRVTTLFNFPLAEGYLLAVRILANTPPSPFRGQCFVEAGLSRIDGQSGTGFQSFLADYLQGGVGLGFPQGRVIQSVEGPGVIRSITGTVPAAGADISETVPANTRWRLVSLRASLTTAVAVANRNVEPQLSDGANVTFRGDSSFNQVASTTIAYDFFAGSQPSGVLGGDQLLLIAQGNILTNGMKIQTNTVNIQAADQWTAPQYVVEEWIDTSN